MPFLEQDAFKRAALEFKRVFERDLVFIRDFIVSHFRRIVY